MHGWFLYVRMAALGYVNMCTDVLNSLEQPTKPMEDFYDGYVVNAIIAAAYKPAETKRWEEISLPVWRGQENAGRIGVQRDFDEDHVLIKEEKCPTAAQNLSCETKQQAKFHSGQGSNGADT